MTRFALPLGRGESHDAGGSTAVMGILNVTPDSFSDGGELADVEAVVAAARKMRADGARILDLGGESTRPKAPAVSAAAEIERVVPCVQALVERVGLPVSVDTTKAEVWDAAWSKGASMLNDVSALAQDDDLGPLVAQHDAAVVLMHRRGTPSTMDAQASYEDLVGEIIRELGVAVERAQAMGIDPSRLILDPGLGFSKTSDQSWALLRELDALRILELPLLIGASRKRFLGAAIFAENPLDRDVATATTSAWCAQAGVEAVRVHAVRASSDAIAVASALVGPMSSTGGQG